MEYVVISVLNGLAYGMLLFMLSAGLTIVFGMMGILNFAHTSFYMMGAFVGYSATKAGHFWLGLLLAPVVVGGIGVLVERLLLKRLHAFGHGQELVFTFGLAIVAEELIKSIFGDFPVPYDIPQQLKFAAFSFHNTQFPFYRVLMTGVAAACFLGILLILIYTRIGIVVRAAERQPMMTEALGHNVGAIFGAVFGVGVALAALAGAIAGAYYPTSARMALDVGSIVFVVVVVGGLGSLAGSFVASLLLGLLTSFAIGLDWNLAQLADLVGLGAQARAAGGMLTLPLSQFAGAIPFLLMLLVLVFWPNGLLGDKQ